MQSAGIGIRVRPSLCGIFSMIDHETGVAGCTAAYLLARKHWKESGARSRHCGQADYDSGRPKAGSSSVPAPSDSTPNDDLAESMFAETDGHRATLATRTQHDLRYPLLVRTDVVMLGTRLKDEPDEITEAIEDHLTHLAGELSGSFGASFARQAGIVRRCRNQGGVESQSSDLIAQLI